MRCGCSFQVAGGPEGVVPVRGGECFGRFCAAATLCGEQSLEVEGAGVHGQAAIGVARPFGFGAIPVELYAVEVGVVEVEGFADAVVGGAVEGDVGGEEAAESVGQGCARGIEDGEVVEAGGAGRGWLAAERLPGVEADVVVVAAGGEEGGGVAHALRDVEAEDAVVEGERAVEVRDAKVDVAHAGLGMDGRSCSWGGHAVGWRRFVGAGVEGYFPLAVNLLPEGDVAAGGGGGLAVPGDGGGVVVSPGKAGIVGRAHLGAFGVPAEFVDGGIPVGDGGNGGAAEDGRLAVIEGDAVVGEPGGECLASTIGDGLRELAFELEQFEDAGG